MCESEPTDELLSHSGIAVRFPEKTHFLGAIFKDTTNSYKLFWFLAVLALIRRRCGPVLKLSDVFTEMLVLAWHSICLYRLSLGRQDILQEVVLKTWKKSALSSSEEIEIVRKYVSSSGETQSNLDFLRRYVPTRFLAPWFAEPLRGKKDSLRNNTISMLAKHSQKTALACPYWIEKDCIHLNASWRAFFSDNMAVIQSFAEYHLAQYIQSRNPNVPGVMNKLRGPTIRQLTSARRLWTYVRDSLASKGQSGKFLDIYSQRPIEDSYAIDHFLPWSFVAHDLVWNLTPVEKSTNSRKSDMLPNLELYLPRLATIHFKAISITKTRPILLQDHSDCFKQDVSGLLALGVEGLTEKYREVISPQAQIAASLGFQADWILGD